MSLSYQSNENIFKTSDLECVEPRNISEQTSLNQLNSSYALSAHSNGSLFIADVSNSRVMEWHRDASNSILWRGAECGMTDQGHLCSPSIIMFDKENTLFVSIEYRKRETVYVGEKKLPWVKYSLVPIRPLWYRLR